MYGVVAELGARHQGDAVHSLYEVKLMGGTRGGMNHTDHVQRYDLRAPVAHSVPDAWSTACDTHKCVRSSGDDIF